MPRVFKASFYLDVLDENVSLEEVRDMLSKHLEVSLTPNSLETDYCGVAIEQLKELSPAAKKLLGVE